MSPALNCERALRDLARATGIVAGQLSQLETRTKRDPTFLTARKIARALRVSLDPPAKTPKPPQATAEAAAALHYAA